MNSKLEKYEFTEEGKKLLPTQSNQYGLFLEINGPDGYFKLKARLVCDYHAEALLNRADKRAEKYIRLKRTPQKTKVVQESKVEK